MCDHEKTKVELIAELETERAKVAAYAEHLASMDRYLTSEKFRIDGRVSSHDILARIRETRSAVTDEEFVGRGLLSKLRTRYGLLGPDTSKRIRWAEDRTGGWAA